MPQDELRVEVEQLVEHKLEAFRHEIRLELMPIKIAIKSHDDQMKDLREGMGDVAQGLARIEGAIAISRDDDRRYQKDTAEKLAAATERLYTYIGEGRGAQVAEARIETKVEKKTTNLREWMKVVAAFVGVSAVAKVLVDAVGWIAQLHLFH